MGDSLGMVMHGYETTVPVPLELMIMHGRAVVRGAKRALVVVDMPFGSYEESPSVAFRNAARVMKETDCGAVKLEGGRRMAETIRYPRRARHSGDGAHRPDAAVHQRARRLQDPGPRAGRVGGHRGRRASAVADAGAFAVVLEAMAEAAWPQRSPRPSPSRPSASAPRRACDGQILVMEDMLGLCPRVPKFVKEFGKVGEAIEDAIASYADEVRNRTFPAPEHTYAMKDGAPTKEPPGRAGRCNRRQGHEKAENAEQQGIRDACGRRPRSA